jgi:cullin 1
MAVLLLFNDTDKLDYSDIKEVTKLTDENLEPALGILCKARVLLPSPEDAKAAPGTSYALNYNFKNKKVKINLNITVKSEQKTESDETHKTIEEDRKLLLQVCLCFVVTVTYTDRPLGRDCPHHEGSKEAQACSPRRRSH